MTPFVLAAAIADRTMAQTRHFGEIESAGRVVAFAYTLPVNFDSRGAYPVLVGPGDATEGSAPGFFWRDGAGAVSWVTVETTAMLENGDDAVRMVLDELRDVVCVEGDRFYLAGWSASSAPAFALAARHPEWFHGLIVVPGGPGGLADDRLRTLPPVMNVVGEHDAAWLRMGRRAHERLQRLGVPSWLEIIPGGRHVLREVRGVPFFERLEVLRTHGRGSGSAPESSPSRTCNRQRR